MTAGSHYKAVPVAVNSTVPIASSRVGGFVPTAAGTWTFTLVIDGVSTTFPGIAVPAGNVGLFHKFPVFCGTDSRSSVTTSVNGAGILFVS
jgi:hypothetical protein